MILTCWNFYFPLPYICHDVIWVRSQRGTHGGLMFQCIGLCYLTFALSAFLWPCRTGREVQAVGYFQLKVVCHFSFLECACKRHSYYIQSFKKTTCLHNWKLLLQIGWIFSYFWLYFHLMPLLHPVKTQRCSMTTSATICCYHLSRGINQEDQWWQWWHKSNLFRQWLLNQWHIWHLVEEKAWGVSEQSELLPGELSNSSTHLSFPSGICVTPCA